MRTRTNSAIQSLSDLRNLYYSTQTLGNLRRKNDQTRAFLQSETGLTITSLHDLWRAYLVAQGIPNQRSLDDMKKRFFAEKDLPESGFGQSLRFNGTTTTLTSPVTPSLTGFNVGFWMKLTKATAQQRIVAWVAGGPNGGFFIEKNSSDTTLKLNVYNGGSQAVNIASSALDLNAWYFVVATFKTNEAKFYLNAAQQGATDTSCSMTTPAGQTLTIGRSSASAAQFFEGYLDQFVFQNSDTPWTQAEITAMYRHGRYPAGSTVTYEMSNNVQDSSGNGNHGTLTAGVYSLDAPALYTPSAVDKLRGWNYSSNYLDGSSSNPWYVETGQLAYDAADIAAAGLNVVSIYADENNAASHIAALDKIYANGQRAIVTRFITHETDYSVATGGSNRTAAIAKLTGMVTNLKGHPAIIAWGFANENNINLGATSEEDWYSLVDAAVAAGKAIDATRPYFTIDADLGTYPGDGSLTNLDLLALNIYRGTTFTDLADDIVAATSKPVFLHEFGRSRTDNLQASQDTQASQVVALLNEAESLFPLVRGWIHFKFTDSIAPGTVFGATAPLAEGVNQSRTKYALYTSIKNYCTTYDYGRGTV